jgi:hypothetical protein
MRPLAALAVALGAAGVVLLGSPALAEAWLLAALFWLHLGAGALGVLALGHLLREDWLAPVRPPLEAAARSLPLLALMLAPVLLAPQLLYPWAATETLEGPAATLLQPWAFGLRGLACLGVWVALGRALTRPGLGKGARRGVSALTLALLLPTATLATYDWVLSRDTAWYASLQGFSLFVQGLAVGLSAAILAARKHPDAEALPGLERALLMLGLAMLWLFFTQYITVWMADLPEEADWYLRRLDTAGAAQMWIALPALLLAIMLAAPPDHGRWRMVTVCWLLLVQSGAHLWWVVRPDAPLARPAIWLDVVVSVGLGLAFLAYGEVERRLMLSRVPSASPDAGARASALRSPPPATG